jgi:cytochrome c
LDWPDGEGVKLVWVALAATVSLIGVARAQAPQILLQQYKCYICHADNESKTGPAYADVAARYRGNSQAVAILTAAIRKGAHGGGPWHMPPHPEVSDVDAKKMARYILSLKK